MADYTTSAGDMVDAIAAEALPDADLSTSTAAIYRANPHLTEYGVKLPAGLEITYPTEDLTPTDDFIRIWS